VAASKLASDLSSDSLQPDLEHRVFDLIFLQYVLKEARIFDIWSRLSPIAMSRKVKSTVLLVCKGGTALNKIYFAGVQRFSEDLDGCSMLIQRRRGCTPRRRSAQETNADYAPLLHPVIDREHAALP
jgi:hypothetical protein